jgi:hypothetical protein
MVLTSNARFAISPRDKRHLKREFHHILTELHKHGLHMTPDTFLVILFILLALLGLAYLSSRNR